MWLKNTLGILLIHNLQLIVSAIQTWNAMVSDSVDILDAKDSQGQRKIQNTFMMSLSLKESARALRLRKIIEWEIITATRWGNVERTECAKGLRKKDQTIKFKKFLVLAVLLEMIRISREKTCTAMARGRALNSDFVKVKQDEAIWFNINKFNCYV